MSAELFPTGLTFVDAYEHAAVSTFLAAAADDEEELAAELDT